MSEILIRTRGGSANLFFLEQEVLALEEDFSKEGIEVKQDSSLEFASVGLLNITIIGNICSNLIQKLIDKICNNVEKFENVNIQVYIKDLNTTFKLPEEKQKLITFFKRNE